MITNIAAGCFTVLYLGLCAFLCRGVRFTPKKLCLGAICSAMTLVLSCLYLPLPTGASITLLSWLPLMALSVVCDYKLAILCGMVCGTLAPFVLPGWSLVHWAQYFLEYLAIFSCMGFAGVFGKKKSAILLGACTAILLRITAQVLSGVVFFGQYAWEGWGAWGYSLVFHLSAKIPEGIVTTLVLLALPVGRLSALAQGGKQK